MRGAPAEIQILESRAQLTDVWKIHKLSHGYFTEVRNIYFNNKTYKNVLTFKTIQLHFSLYGFEHFGFRRLFCLTMTANVS